MDMKLRQKLAVLLSERISNLELLNALENLYDEETMRAYNRGFEMGKGVKNGS